jgi:hypothetical protein
MSVATDVAIAVTFVWSGMILAISFIEAPLKFRAPDVTIAIGLGIGRLVFRALNAVEAVLAVVLVGLAVLEPPPQRIVIAGAVALGVLAVQLAVIRPRLTRRSDLVLAGADVPRSRGHLGYVGLELVKLCALLATGTLLLSH